MNKQENIEAKSGKLDSNKKMAVSGTEKWNSLLNMGYKPIGVV